MAAFGSSTRTAPPSPLPATDPTGGVWLTESSVGSELARGVCQSCSIILVEANSPSKSDLSTAVNTAARAGATVVLTTNNQAEAPDDSQYASDYSHPGTAFVSAAGDSAYTGLVYFPATLPTVIAVGGTSLNLSTNGRYQGESAWPATTSGCSMYNGASAWQASLAASVGCGGKRAVADIAAVAEPGALVHVQDVGSPCGPSWCEADGTSVAAPIIAGAIGLAGSVGSSEAKLLYQHAHSEPSAFHDITTGTNGFACGQSKPICAARRGYDGPTGLGTPNGLAAFLPSGGALDPRRPLVTVSAPHGRLSVDRQWATQVKVANDNPFSLGGSVILRRRLRVGKRLQMITFATGNLTLGPLASAPERLTIVNRNRALLKHLRSVTVSAQLQVHGPAGRTVTLSKSFRLAAP